MIKKFICLLWLLCAQLSVCALSEGVIVDLIADLQAQWSFAPSREILEIVFPDIYGADCCLIRMGDETLMVDSATTGQGENVRRMLAALNVTHVDKALNTHPHNDHLPGFETLIGDLSIGELMLSCEEDYNVDIRRVLRRIRKAEFPVEITRANDGDVLNLGNAKLEFFQRRTKQFTTNDLSMCFLLTHGERTMLFTGDIENRAQAALVSTPPACGMKADVLKYPHHGLAKINNDLYDMISPELAIITNTKSTGKEGMAYMERKGFPAYLTIHHMLRLRTDGFIWVLDDLQQ